MKKFSSSLSLLLLIVFIFSCSDSETIKSNNRKSTSDDEIEKSLLFIRDNSASTYLFDDDKYIEDIKLQYEFYQKMAQSTEEPIQKNESFESVISKNNTLQDEYELLSKKINENAKYLKASYSNLANKSPDCVSCKSASTNLDDVQFHLLSLAKNKPKLLRDFFLDVANLNKKDILLDDLLHEKVVAAVNNNLALKYVPQLREHLDYLKSYCKKTGKTPDQLFNISIQKTTESDAFFKNYQINKIHLKKTILLIKTVIGLNVDEYSLSGVKYSVLLGSIQSAMYDDKNRSKDISINSIGDPYMVINDCVGTLTCYQGVCIPDPDLGEDGLGPVPVDTQCEGAVYVCYGTCFFTGPVGPACAYLCYCSYCRGPRRDKICFR